VLVGNAAEKKLFVSKPSGIPGIGDQFRNGNVVPPSTQLRNDQLSYHALPPVRPAGYQIMVKEAT
jgi:hypothetical protein